MAMVLNPTWWLPRATTGLGVIVQDQILHHQAIHTRLKTMLLITHDMAVVAEIAIASP